MRQKKDVTVENSSIFGGPARDFPKGSLLVNRQDFPLHLGVVPRGTSGALPGRFCSTWNTVHSCGAEADPNPNRTGHHGEHFAASKQEYDRSGTPSMR